MCTYNYTTTTDLSMQKKKFSIISIPYNAYL